MSIAHHWIYTTWPDAASAREAALKLVEERLCGCANILPGVESIYSWEGKIEHEQEVVMILKAPASTSARLNARILELHPYDTPCVMALPVVTDASAPDYLSWLANQTQDAM